MTNYPSNSNKSKEKPTVNIKEKDNVISKGGEAIVNGVVDVVEGTVKNTLIPNVKDTIYNVANDFLRRILYGKDGIPPTDSRGRLGVYREDYSSYSRDRRSNNQSEGYIVSWKTDWSKVTWSTRGAAESVLYRMRSEAHTAGVVSVKDYFLFSDIKIDDYTASNFGWTDEQIDRAFVKESIQDRDYFINLCSPERIR